jgi:DMSO/TMAO reductase YedYZ molybdopterin-dependent catalytic subunit
VAARVVDWWLAALLAALAATGTLTLFAGSPNDAWVFAVHDAFGAGIALLLVFKVRRVWPGLHRATRWERSTLVGAAGLALVIGSLLSGLLWSDGANFGLAGYSLLSWHDALGAILLVAIAVHMVLRAKPVRARDLAHRRQFLVTASLAAGSFVAWRAQRPLQALLGLRAARRRFTGSYDAGSFTGNDFPSTSWVADRPRPIAPSSYRLRVVGMASRELALALQDLARVDELVATLDCTGGFYSTQRWQGVRLGRMIDLAGAEPGVRHVSVASQTGYRWGFTLDDARGLLLATHVGGQPLSHEHGAPVRLVVPGARGYQWVKWVERIELLDSPDYGAPASTLWSSFTAAGSGA